MLIRMKTQISGTHNGRRWPTIGETADVSGPLGEKMCSAGLAEPVKPADRPADNSEQEKPAETATPPPAETTSPPKPETPAKPATEKRRGRPKLPRDDAGNIVRE